MSSYHRVAPIDLRFADGARFPSPVVPGLPMDITLEFEPMDVVLKAGTRVDLVLAPLGEDYVSPSVTQPVQVSFEGSQLRLPIVEPTPDQFFTPPVWSGVATAGPPQP